MKKLFYSLLFLCAAIGMVSCEPVPSANFSLSPNSLQMKVGDMSNINIVGAVTDIEWSSSNESVATVFHGVVTAIR